MYNAVHLARCDRLIFAFHSAPAFIKAPIDTYPDAITERAYRACDSDHAAHWERGAVSERRTCGFR